MPVKYLQKSYCQTTVFGLVPYIYEYCYNAALIPGLGQ